MTSFLTNSWTDSWTDFWSDFCSLPETICLADAKHLSTSVMSSGIVKTILLNVSKFQNEFMKPSFLPKYEQNIVRISALTQTF